MTKRKGEKPVAPGGSGWAAALAWGMLYAWTAVIIVDALSHVVFGHYWTFLVMQQRLFAVLTWVAGGAGWEMKTLEDFVTSTPPSLVDGHTLAWASKDATVQRVLSTLDGEVLVYPFPVMLHNLRMFDDLPGAILVHAVGGTLTLVAGGLQFSAGLRSRFPAVHRWCGRVYVLAFTAVALSGMRMAPRDWAGEQAGILMFYGMAFFCMVPTWMGVVCAWRGDYQQHSVWMTRSYFEALSVSVMLRVGYGTVLPWLSRWDPQGHQGTIAYCALNVASYTLPVIAANVYMEHFRAPALHAKRH